MLTWTFSIGFLDAALLSFRNVNYFVKKKSIYLFIDVFFSRNGQHLVERREF
jgi:hypothetical protein